MFHAYCFLHLINKQTHTHARTHTHTHQTMLEDKLRSTDWDATCEAIEEAVARESYLTWLREQERRVLASRQGTQVLTHSHTYTHLPTRLRLVN